jgi:hypothetical protein
VHFLVCAYTAQPVDQPLDRPQDKIEKSLLAIEYPGHENAQGLGNREDHQQKENNLEPTVSSHN